MNIITIVGDTHGHYEAIQERPNSVIHLGDVGIGFRSIKVPTIYDEEWNSYILSTNFHFIAGNHDDRMECLKYKNYLGHYGYNEELDIFFISGADSIDKNMRIPGISWWDYEELNYREQLEVIELYSKIKPSTVISHDCPQFIAQHYFNMNVRETSVTRGLLEALFNLWEPKTHCFGHWHESKKILFRNTEFICLGINEHLDLERE